jgi:hypothetical protein
VKKKKKEEEEEDEEEIRLYGGFNDHEGLGREIILSNKKPKKARVF